MNRFFSTATFWPRAHRLPLRLAAASLCSSAALYSASAPCSPAKADAAVALSAEDVAQPPTEEVAPPPQQDATSSPKQRGSEPSNTASTVRAFHETLIDAKAAFIAGRDAEALQRFEALVEQAPTPEDRRIVQELAAIVRERLDETERQKSPYLRTLDELSVLYTTAFAYGFGTSAWVALQVQPGSFAAAIVPFVAITGAAVGGVALADNLEPFKLGMPQAISAGVYLGALEGVMLTGYHHAVAKRRENNRTMGARSVSTVLWAGATLGGVAGGVLGALREPTPGRVSFAASGGLWGGLLASFAGAASEGRTGYRVEKAFGIGAIGYNAGLIAALIASPHLSPSVARVRLVDLGGLAGGLVGAGTYMLIADDAANARATFGISAAGAAVGLGLAWWATSDMAEQHYPKPLTALGNLRPTVAPLKNGVVGLVEWQM